jgi:AcrR family transcriptional regulator
MSQSTVKTGGRQRRERGSITPEEIIKGAFAVADRDSLDNLSMPELARHLGVGVTSVYWYFRKKDDLIQTMSDQAIRTVHSQLPQPGDPAQWRAFLAGYCRKMREVYLANDTIADLVLVRTRSYSLSATHLTYQGVEDALAMLVKAGFTPLTAWNLYSALSIYTRGIIISERIQRMNNAPSLDDRQIKLLEPEKMPLLTTLVEEESISLSMVGDDNFEYGLEAMLETFERQLQAAK